MRKNENESGETRRLMRDMKGYFEPKFTGESSRRETSRKDKALQILNMCLPTYHLVSIIAATVVYLTQKRKNLEDEFIE